MSLLRSSGLWATIVIIATHSRYVSAADPPGPTLPNIAKNCNKWYVAKKDEGCWNAYSSAAITPEQFYTWNPDVPSDCHNNFWPTYAYCVGVGTAVTTSRSSSTAPATTSSSVTATTQSSSKATSTATTRFTTTNTEPYTILHPITDWNITATTRETAFPPTRTQTGQPRNCNDWHYVVGGDSCTSIRNRYNMAMDDLLDWNPDFQDDCSGLQVGWWACIHVQPTKQASIVFNNQPEGPVIVPNATSYTPAATPIGPDFTPVPSHGPMPASCKSWYKSEDGDRCDNVLAKNPLLSRAQFFEWNPVLQKNCDGLWSGVYYCVWASNDLPDPATVTTRPVNSRADSVANCAAWYLATNGDDCELIVTMFGRFSQADFVSWNPSVKSTCGGIADDIYYCVGVPGSPTTRTAAIPAQTSPPSEAPTQSGLAVDCTKLWFVSSLDTCASIARAENIALSDFYTWNPSVAGTKRDCADLKPDYNVCVMIKGGSSLPPSVTGQPPASASSSTASSPATSTAPQTSPTSKPVVVSTDGTCSGTKGFTCAGSTYGNCCSAQGWCGSTNAHCGSGCQTAFGTGCSSNSDQISPDGTCGGAKGYMCTGSTFGSCCSTSGWCGDSSDHCAAASCLPAFGKCTADETGGKKASTDGSCAGTQGFTCLGTSFGECCSQYGWCGKTADHCGTGCLSEFGKCT